jgi:hypothetical protein
MARTIARNRDIIWRRIEDKVVLIGKEGQVIHVLNKTAACIWELCDGANGADEIAESLCESFDVPPEEAGADVRDIITKLESMGLVERRDGTASTE